MHKLYLAAEKSGKFNLWWDEIHGSASIDLFGFWSIDDAREFLPVTEKILARSRARHGKALVMFDTTGSEIATSAIIENFDTNGPMLVKPTDRAAMVVTSNLMKLQMKRMRTVTENAKFFAIRSEAEAWLHADIIVGD